MMEEKYGVPWLKVNYVGTKTTAKSLRKMAEFFDDPEITRKTEEIIAEEKVKYEAEVERYRKKLQGKQPSSIQGVPEVTTTLTSLKNSA